MKRLVLASTSPWRLAMLRDVGLNCEAARSDVDEDAIVEASPARTAVARARAKALAVARQQVGALVIGADQVAHLDGEAFGKPEDDARWLSRLAALRGRTHTLSTAVALAEGDAVETFVVHTAVKLRADLSDEELRAYIDWGEARGCAGGYQVEKRGAWLIESIDGDWWNVIGLPLLPLLAALRSRGWSLQDAVDPGWREAGGAD